MYILAPHERHNGHHALNIKTLSDYVALYLIEKRGILFLLFVIYSLNVFPVVAICISFFGFDAVNMF